MRKMDIIFVFSGTKKQLPSPIIENQALSLVQNGHTILYFPIKSKGIKGYFLSIRKLKEFIKN